MAVLVSDLYDRLKNLFSDGADDLTILEETIAASAFASALSIIQEEFLARGGTITQVDLWLRQDEFRMDIATFASLMNLGKDRDEKDEHAAWAKHFDRREELVSMTIALTDGTILPSVENVDAADVAAAVRPVGVFNLKNINTNLRL